MDTIGARIRHARRCAGVSQTVLAKEVGVDQTTVSKWERDAGPPPRSDEAVALCEHLGCDIAWLLTGRGEAPAEAPASELDEAPELDATGTD